MLLNGHTTDDGSHFDGLLEFHRDHRFDMILDLDGELSSGTEDEAFNGTELGILLSVLFGLLKLLDA